MLEFCSIFSFDLDLREKNLCHKFLQDEAAVHKGFSSVYVT